VLFFIAILIGGRGSILGPLIATVVLTWLPEFAAPLVVWSTFLYATLLLVIVLAVPGGIAALLDFKNRRPLESSRAILPRPELLPEILGRRPASGGITLRGRRPQLRRGACDRRARPDDRTRTGPRAHRPERIRQDHDAERDLRLQHAGGGRSGARRRAPAPGHAQTRAPSGIARTFQTPRPYRRGLGLAERDGRGRHPRAGHLPRVAAQLAAAPRDEAMLREDALLALRTVGLEPLAEVRADRLQHSELRFMEIARTLMLRPRFLLLDEPAAGLSTDEIRRLGALVRAISRQGTGVLLVEHHADLIFEICDRVTVLNLGRVLAAGTPAEIRVHQEVVSAYLGA
jgi:ABC-type branched-subunit amino acid transport system ATPase component